MRRHSSDFNVSFAKSYQFQKPKLTAVMQFGNRRRHLRNILNNTRVEQVLEHSLGC